MKDQTLSNKHRDELFSIVTQAKLNHSEFRFDEAQSVHLNATTVSIFRHRSDKHFFLFDYTAEQHFSRFSPGQERKIEFEFDEDWPQRRNTFMRWLKELKQELKTADPWSNIAAETRVFGAGTIDDDNSLFGEDEREYIADGVKEVREYLVSVHKIDLETIISKLKYLEESSERLGRKDWKNIFVAVMFSIVIDAFLPAETTREVFRFAYSAFQNVFQQSVYLP